MNDEHKALNDHSFAICAYKESPFLEECILSLKRQTVESDIFISTSTPNKSIDLLAKKYNIPVHVSNGSGIGGDWNSALNNARTQYVTIAHQDDVYLKDYAQKLLQQLRRNEDALIAFCDYSEIYKGKVIPDNINLNIKKVLLSPLKFNNRRGFVKRIPLAFGDAICCPAVTFNIARLGGFQFDESLKCDLDWDAWEKLSKMNGAFLYLSEKLMLHRIHEDSETSHILEDDSRSIEDLQILRRFWPVPIARLIGKAYKNSEKENQK